MKTTNAMQLKSIIKKIANEMGASPQLVLSPVLRDSWLIAGISTPFSDFKNFYYYYKQCLNALRIGIQKNPESWYHRFEDYASDYICELYTSYSIRETIFPVGLINLIEYDKNKGTDYTFTLKTYLDCCMSETRTQKILFIHRNTLSYRLKRIREIINTDLYDADKRLVMQLSLRLFFRDQNE